MIKVRKQTIEEEVVISKTCDVCKKTYEVDNKDHWMEVQEFHHIRFTGGYDSVFGDGVTMSLDICQHCLKEKLGEYMSDDRA